MHDRRSWPASAPARSASSNVAPSNRQLRPSLRISTAHWPFSTTARACLPVAQNDRIDSVSFAPSATLEDCANSCFEGVSLRRGCGFRRDRRDPRERRGTCVGGLDWIRTSGIRLRRAALYPTELRGRGRRCLTRRVGGCKHLMREASQTSGQRLASVRRRGPRSEVWPALTASSSAAPAAPPPPAGPGDGLPSRSAAIWLGAAWRTPSRSQVSAKTTGVERLQQHDVGAVAHRRQIQPSRRAFGVVDVAGDRRSAAAGARARPRSRAR